MVEYIQSRKKTRKGISWHGARRIASDVHMRLAVGLRRSKTRTCFGRHERLTGGVRKHRARCLCSAMLDTSTPEYAPRNDMHDCLWSSQPCNICLPNPLELANKSPTKPDVTASEPIFSHRELAIDILCWDIDGKL